MPGWFPVTFWRMARKVALQKPRPHESPFWNLFGVIEPCAIKSLTFSWAFEQLSSWETNAMGFEACGPKILSGLREACTLGLCSPRQGVGSGIRRSQKRGTVTLTCFHPSVGTRSGLRCVYPTPETAPYPVLQMLHSVDTLAPKYPYRQHSKAKLYDIGAHGPSVCVWGCSLGNLYLVSQSEDAETRVSLVRRDSQA